MMSKTLQEESLHILSRQPQRNKISQFWEIPAKPMEVKHHDSTQSFLIMTPEHREGD